MGAAPRSGAIELEIVTLRLSLTTGLQTRKRGLVRQRRLHILPSQTGFCHAAQNSSSDAQRPMIDRNWNG
jgi:hypothetical protein